MAYPGYPQPSYAYGQGPNDPYAVQYNIAQTSPVMTDEQYDEEYDEQFGDNSMASCGRNHSNVSDISGVSLSSSSHTYASTPSPTTPTGNLHWGGYSTVTKTEHESSSLTPGQWDPQFPTFDPPDSTRWTPITLGWSTNSELLKLYKFVVRKSKEPYFELMGPWTPTAQTPAKVYLDSPENIVKGEYLCLYPWGCTGKQTVFSRPADLERHYKNVHADEKDCFPCDYLKCDRATTAFTRKDHYRDHLRDFHKEDIGSAKGEKKLDRKKWLALQKIWLAERKISAKHWRCTKCLVKHYVADGWDCEQCKTTCEQERQDARIKLAPKVEAMEPMEEDTDAQYSNTGTSSVTGYNNCDACQNTRWILAGMEWVACQCQCQWGQ